MELERQIPAVAEWLRQARSAIVLTGAGVSAESGIPTFRDARTGLWARYDPMKLASPDGFAADPGLVCRWYMERLRGLAAAPPNAGHHALAGLESLLGTVTIYTQNVDDLHERAGSRQVFHLHGRIDAFRCHRCHEPYRQQTFNPGSQVGSPKGFGAQPGVGELEARVPAIAEAGEPPRCACGGLVRPDVFWFGERLPEAVLERAWEDAAACQVMIVAGTSGEVYPAAALPRLARERGARVIDVNPEPGPIAEIADCPLRGPSGVILPRILTALWAGSADA